MTGAGLLATALPAAPAAGSLPLAPAWGSPPPRHVPLYRRQEQTAGRSDGEACLATMLVTEACSQHVVVPGWEV